MSLSKELQKTTLSESEIATDDLSQSFSITMSVNGAESSYVATKMECIIGNSALSLRHGTGHPQSVAAIRRYVAVINADNRKV